MLCQVLLYSRVTQSFIYVSFSHAVFRHVLPQDMSSLCCTIGVRCLSILNGIVHICQPQTPQPSYSHPNPPTLFCHTYEDHGWEFFDFSKVASAILVSRLFRVRRFHRINQQEIRGRVPRCDLGKTLRLAQSLCSDLLVEMGIA